MATITASGKKMGRPKTPDYYKKTHRYITIEKTLMPAIEKLENENDRKCILEALNLLKV